MSDIVLDAPTIINDAPSIHNHQQLDSAPDNVDTDHVMNAANVQDNYDSASSPQDSEPIPTPNDEPLIDPPFKRLVSDDVDMSDPVSIDATIAPPSPAPSGVSQHMNGMSLNGHPPSPSNNSPNSYAAPLSPSSTPPTTAAAIRSVPTPATSHVVPQRDRPSDDSDARAQDQRPAKRARTEVVASPLSPKSPSPSSSTPRPTHTTLSPNQFKFAQSTLRTLRKQKDAAPFNHPVDHLALGIPHYPSVIKHPMDFSTVEKKLAASNIAKPDPSPTAQRYYSIEEWIADLKLTFDNCYTFNGPDHIISQCAKRLQASLERALKNMPAPSAPTPLFKAPTPPPPPPPAPEKKAPRRSSTAVPTIRRSDEASASEFVSARPKREIHPPPPKDIDYAEPSVAKRPKLNKAGKAARRKDDGTLDQLRFCMRIVNDLYKKQYANFANFFYDPVDAELVPNYYKIIKQPMDLSTLKKNLDNKVYANANKFYEDFQLMIRNSVKFNPVGTVVYIAGQDLQQVFHEKWRALPPLHSPPPDTDEEDDEDDTIQHLETQLDSLKATIDALKTKDKGARALKNKNASRPSGSSKASSSTARPRTSASTKKSASKKGGAGARRMDADAILSFEEKKELSETIQNLEGSALEEVIQIIHTGVPEIGDNTDEIEIEIDALPANVLRSLWNLVIKPKAAPPPPAKPSNKSGGRNHPATGGLKRKSMDEVAEAEKMRELEARIRMFGEQPGMNGVGGAAPGGTSTSNGAGGAGQVKKAAPGVPGVPGLDADSGSDSESDSGSDSSDSD